MKKNVLLIILLTLLLIMSVGCSKNQSGAQAKTNGEKVDLIVFAAASMTETLEEIKDLYEKENHNVEIIYTFDSSGTLKTQIEEGAKCDVFISAAQKQMNALDSNSGQAKNDNIIDSESRIDLLENKVTLAIPSGSTKEINSFEDIGTEKVEKIALGNSDVPVGQYSEELLTNLGIWEEIQGKVTYGSNVKEVTTWISENVVDCGIIYKTDAFSAGLEIVSEEDGKYIETPVIYPAALVAKSENSEEAKNFLDFLQGTESKEIFKAVGFEPVE